MKEHLFSLREMKERIFYLDSSLEEKSDLFEKMEGEELTILMTPFSSFHSENINLPKDKYFNSVLNFLKNGDNPAIILSDYNLDRLILETIKGNLNQPRIFIQSCTEMYKGFTYYKKEKELENLVKKINPKKIKVGGSFLEETIEDLKKWNLKEESLERVSFVGTLYLLFRDRYFTEIDEELSLR